MVTKNDVAKRAGVSSATVYRVINNVGYVSDEARQNVTKAIKELGYRPNMIARSLRTQESHQLLYVDANIDNPFYTEIFRGIEYEALKNGYTTVVNNYNNKTNYLDFILQRQFDGVVMPSYVCSKYKIDLVNRNIPVIAIESTRDYTRTGEEVVNFEEHGTEIALNHLIDFGHTKIAHITSEQPKINRKVKSFNNTLQKLGFRDSDYFIMAVKPKKTYYHAGYNATMQLIKEHPDVTAIFAYNDMMAIGAMNAFFEMGLSIPGDISVVGFDNIAQSQFAYPPLTTVEVPKFNRGVAIAKTLLQMIKGEPVDYIELDPPCLMLRGSTRRV